MTGKTLIENINKPYRNSAIEEIKNISRDYLLQYNDLSWNWDLSV